MRRQYLDMDGFRQISQSQYLRIEASSGPTCLPAAALPEGYAPGGGGNQPADASLAVRQTALPTVSIIWADAPQTSALKVSAIEVPLSLVGRATESATLALDAGAAHALDANAPFRALLDSGAVIGLSGGSLTLVVVPRYLPARDGPGGSAVFTAPDAAVDLILAQAGQLAGRTLAPRLAHACEAGLLALLAVAGEAGDGAAGAADSLYHSILADIAANCRDHDYGVAQVARRFKVNVRTLQKMFQKHGSTLKEQITTARLDLAGTALRDPANAGRKVSDIAFEAGFNDIATFNRLFRKAYGRAPSAFRSRAMRLEAAGNGAAGNGATGNGTTGNGAARDEPAAGTAGESGAEEGADPSA